MKRAALAVVIIIALSAWLVPRLLIGTRLDELPPDHREAAEEAIESWSWACLDNPISDAVVLIIEVVRVDDVPGRNVHAVTLRSYTIFGIELWTYRAINGGCRLIRGP